jgi:hypothetical protein
MLHEVDVAITVAPWVGTAKWLTCRPEHGAKIAEVTHLKPCEVFFHTLKITLAETEQINVAHYRSRRYLGNCLGCLDHIAVPAIAGNPI